MGAHILAIKDMAGLCRPFAAKKLVKTLKERSASRSISTRTTRPEGAGVGRFGCERCRGRHWDLAPSRSMPAPLATNLNSTVASL
jgi:pyruvate carboxylase